MLASRINFADLIANWENYQKVFKPTFNFLIGNKDTRVVLASLSVISARQETWDYLVSLTSYAQNKSIQAGNREVYETLIKGQVDNSEVIPHIKELSSLPLDDVLAGGDVIYELISPRTVLAVTAAMSSLQYCKGYCEGNPDPPRCIIECMAQMGLDIPGQP